MLFGGPTGMQLDNLWNVFIEPGAWDRFHVVEFSPGRDKLFLAVWIAADGHTDDAMFSQNRNDVPALWSAAQKIAIDKCNGVVRKADVHFHEVWLQSANGVALEGILILKTDDPVRLNALASKQQLEKFSDDFGILDYQYRCRFHALDFLMCGLLKPVGTRLKTALCEPSVSIGGLGEGGRRGKDTAELEFLHGVFPHHRWCNT